MDSLDRPVARGAPMQTTTTISFITGEGCAATVNWAHCVTVHSQWTAPSMRERCRASRRSHDNWPAKFWINVIVLPGSLRLMLEFWRIMAIQRCISAIGLRTFQVTHETRRFTVRAFSSGGHRGLDAIQRGETATDGAPAHAAPLEHTMPMKANYTYETHGLIDTILAPNPRILKRGFYDLTTYCRYDGDRVRSASCAQFGVRPATLIATSCHGDEALMLVEIAQPATFR
jgi:hypothetical protein